MNKGLTLLTLLSATQAAPPKGRAQSTNWWQNFPYYSDNGAGDINMVTLATTQGYAWAAGPLFYGGYKCVRKGAIFNFPQTTTAYAVAAAVAIQTFYGADTDRAAAASQGVLAATAAGNNDSECTYIVSTDKVDGTGAAIIGATLVKNVNPAVIVPNSIFYVGALSQGINYAFLGLVATAENRIAIQWNNDFLLASLWQNGKAAATAAATDYCSRQWTELDAATLTSKIITGFAGNYKCTFQVESKIATGAAQMVLTKAQTTKFNFQWAEWEGGVLSTGTQFITATDTSPLYLGAYAKEWPNPIMSWSVNGAAANTASTNIGAAQPINDYDPLVDGYTMSPGKVMWWPSEKINGAVSTSATTTMDFLKMKADYDSYTAVANTYNTAVTTYNTDKDAYNKALADEKTRKADFFKAMFDPAVVIPTRPCQPTRPGAFSGIDFKYDTTTAITDAEKLTMKGTFAYNGGAVSAAASFKVGYQLPSVADTTMAAGDGAGRTYGYFGAGNLQVVTTNKAFQWKTADATKTHHMMVSVLPYMGAEAAFTSGQTIEITFDNKAFDSTMYAISKPSQPASTTAPDAVGAKALAASCVAVAAVAASLF